MADNDNPQQGQKRPHDAEAVDAASSKLHTAPPYVPVPDPLPLPPEHKTIVPVGPANNPPSPYEPIASRTRSKTTALSYIASKSNAMGSNSCTINGCVDYFLQQNAPSTSIKADTLLYLQHCIEDLPDLIAAQAHGAFPDHRYHIQTRVTRSKDYQHNTPSWLEESEAYFPIHRNPANLIIHDLNVEGDRMVKYADFPASWSTQFVSLNNQLFDYRNLSSQIAAALNLSGNILSTIAEGFTRPSAIYDCSLFYENILH